MLKAMIEAMPSRLAPDLWMICRPAGRASRLHLHIARQHLSDVLIGRRAKCGHFYGFRNAVVRKTLSDR
jgi:hypothetical protein